MYQDLTKYLIKPDSPKTSTAAFWDDEHISKGLLEAHLNAGWDAASRKHKFIERSAEWIAKIAPPCDYPALLDLGCGPGLYAEQFFRFGYSATGIDFSKRSIDYAVNRLGQTRSHITYKYMNYLSIDYKECFNLITIIYGDYCVLSNADRKIFRDNAYKALVPGGKLILDCFTEVRFNNEKEENSFEVCEDGGFWSETGYIAFNITGKYPKESAFLRRHVIVKETVIHCYDFFDKRFTIESLEQEIYDAGFTHAEYFSDIAGKPYSKRSETLCGVFTK